jgi:hypothetical protein
MALDHLVGVQIPVPQLFFKKSSVYPLIFRPKRIPIGLFCNNYQQAFSELWRQNDNAL